MCGIAGIINLDKRPVAQSVLDRMVGVQGHRGPDDRGSVIYDDAALGHVRLSIIDLSESASQPMQNEDSNLSIVHNGEIYNYLELRDVLKRSGHVFRSRSDTEVILHAYEEWREDCVKHFNGMWAFAILDRRRRQLFCSRDRFGVKPFYYYFDGATFAFSSEIKALLEHPAVSRDPNDKAIFDYLSSGYGYMDISDETFFKGIKKLEAGYNLKIELGGPVGFAIDRYWDIEPGRKETIRNDKEAIDRFYELFEDAVKLRLRSDVPVGVSLSGGLDSTSIACVAARLAGGKSLETFSSCYDDKRYDERAFISPVLERTGAKANYIFTHPETLFDDMDRIIWHQEEPYSTLSILPQWYIMKSASQKGVKVLLTGQGGDETLAGYHKYYYYLFADLMMSLRFPSLVQEVRLFDNMRGPSAALKPASKIALAYASPAPLKAIIKKHLKKSPPGYLRDDFVSSHSNGASFERRFKSILNNDLYNGIKVSPLPSLLHIDDRSSMAHSVESRSVP